LYGCSHGIKWIDAHLEKTTSSLVIDSYCHGGVLVLYHKMHIVYERDVLRAHGLQTVGTVTPCFALNKRRSADCVRVREARARNSNHTDDLGMYHGMVLVADIFEEDRGGQPSRGQIALEA
jgi:hypothetical protein